MEKLQPLILQSLELLVIGMGTVFVILGLLIFLINVVTRMLSVFKLDEETAHFPNTLGAARTHSKPQQDSELVAVISSAIARYRKQH